VLRVAPRHAGLDAGLLAADAGALLDERHVPPGVGAEPLAVVIGHAAEVQAVLGDVVPLLAGDLAGLAADADAGVGKEPDPQGVVGVSAERGRIDVAVQRIHRHTSVPVLAVMPARR
jgi:hypothetical protein